MLSYLATGLTAAKKFYLSDLNSEDHPSPRKWSDTNAVDRFREQINRHKCIVHQGKGVLLFANQEEAYAESIQIRAPGDAKSPGVYHGNRNTEPRTSIIIRKIELPNWGSVDLAFFQLETNTEDRRIAPLDVLNNSSGSRNRRKQICNLCNEFEEGTHVILMGDFNARPGVIELDQLTDQYGFRYILPIGTPGEPLDYVKSEEEQGWPFTHLEHRILIDHAFVKGFEKISKCELRVINLPIEDEGKRYSDHRPIALTIEV